MRSITESLSKEIVAAQEGEIVGIVTNAYVDRKLSRLRGYKVCSEDRDAERMLPIRRLIGQGDAMIVKGEAVLTEPQYPTCPIGAKVFDSVGNFLGILRDVLFDESNGAIFSLLANDKEISPDRVVSFGKSALILRAPCHDGIVFRTRKTRPAAPKEQEPLSPAALAPEPLPAPQEPSEQAAPDLQEEIPYAEPLSGEYSFLLGRTILKDIAVEGKLLARESENVTPAILRRAREKGKLVELTVNSRK